MPLIPELGGNCRWVSGQPSLHSNPGWHSVMSQKKKKKNTKNFFKTTKSNIKLLARGSFKKHVGKKREGKEKINLPSIPKS